MHMPRTLLICGILGATLLPIDCTTKKHQKPVEVPNGHSDPSIALGADRELRFPLPPGLSPLSSARLRSLRCEAVVSTGVFANTDIEPKSILAKLTKGMDDLSIQVEGDILYFLTSSDFKLGSKASKFRVVHNSEQQILAIIPEEEPGAYTVDIFALNKKTGLAVWTKTKSLDIFSDGLPSAQSFYFACR